MREAYIARRARALGLDPRAVLAVASMEGLSGGVGDGGHAFGPFQLNDAGGVLTNHPASHHSNRWAWSNAGINYALKGIASVARGLHGENAIRAIVNRFERPQAPGPEIAGAIRNYGKTPVKGGGQPMSFGRSPNFSGRRGTNGTNREALLQVIMAQNAAFAQGESDPQAYQAALVAAKMAAPSGGVPRPGKGGHPQGVAFGGGPKGGERAMLLAIRKAEKMGLHVSENPFVDHVDPVHVSDSFHYRDFKRRVHGREVGRAADVSGSPELMRRYALWLRRNRAREAELFYDPLGGWKYGQSIGAIGGHSDHVHVAY